VHGDQELRVFLLRQSLDDFVYSRNPAVLGRRQNAFRIVDIIRRCAFNEEGRREGLAGWRRDVDLIHRQFLNMRHGLPQIF
jgi:hypothetical protein